MTEYSRIARGNFTATGTASAAASRYVNLPFQPDFVEIWNYTNIKAAPTANKVTMAWWDSGLIDAATNTMPTMVELYNGTPVVSFDTITSGGISTFAAALALQFGTSLGVTAITKANPAVVTTASAHGYNIGDTVILQNVAIGSTNDMILLNEVPFTITTVPSTTTFTINWNTNQSNYTALTAQTVPTVKKVLYPFLYVPQDNVISALTLASTTTVATTMYHNFEIGQEIAFRIPPQWGTIQLNSLPNFVTPGSPIYGYVISVTDNWTFVVNINSTGYTAFNTNPVSPSLPGLSYPQVLAVGDVNTGGNVISSGSPLYPSPSFPTSTNRVATINGPAIRGAFVNNTAQGFFIGTGVATTDTSATLMTTGDLVYWQASLFDFKNP
jgi:hypothetical protein